VFEKEKDIIYSKKRIEELNLYIKNQARGYMNEVNKIEN
jgi:hypothetical protein